MGRLTLPVRLALWSRSSTPRAREIVLEVLKKTYPVPVHSRELFRRIREEYPDEKPQLPSPDAPIVQIRRVTTSPPETSPSAIPSLSDHLIRSAKYLKEIIMNDLVHRKQVQKVHSMREPTPEELTQKTSKKKSKKLKNSSTASITINVKGMVDEWGWVLRTSEEVEKMKQEEERIRSALEGQKRLDTKQIEKDTRVRFLEQWGHLNIRRQRARAEKLEREEKKTIQLEKLREEGRRAGQIVNNKGSLQFSNLTFLKSQKPLGELLYLPTGWETRRFGTNKNNSIVRISARLHRCACQLNAYFASFGNPDKVLPKSSSTPTLHNCQAMTSVCERCVQGYILDGQPSGVFEGPSYFKAAPVPSKRAVVILTDIFGLKVPNPKLLADRYSEKLGCDVWVPDLFEGNPPFTPEQLKPIVHDVPNTPTSFLTKIKFGATILTSLPALMRIRANLVDSRMTTFARRIKLEKKYDKVGVIGFCLGGAQVVRLASTDMFDSAIVAHPGPINKKEIQAMKIPTSWICAEGTVHGFAARPNLSIPVVKEAFEASFEQTITWFNKTLPVEKTD